MPWNPNAMCDGKRAEERAIWLQQNKGMGEHAARNQIMKEFPQQFQGIGGLIGGIASAVASAIDQATTGWNPNAMCDGKRAEERSVWLQQNEGMTAHAAQQRVMREFPAQFAHNGHHGHHGHQGYHGGGGLPTCGMWNPSALCDGTRAEERVLWLQQHERLSVEAARQKVMTEFPAAFGNNAFNPGMSGGFSGPTGAVWNPNALCDGTRAEERVLWLQQHERLSVEAARQKVMTEFPAAFGSNAFNPGMSGGFSGPTGAVWNPNASCDGTRAEERVLWLQQHERLSVEAARQKVMTEFPAAFGSGGLNPGMNGGFSGPTGAVWNPNAFCDGTRAEERVLWLQQNQGKTTEAARCQIMKEFPAAFSGGFGGSGGRSYNPNASCGGTRAEERVLWLQQNKGMTVEAARLQIMQEFPHAF